MYLFIFEQEHSFVHTCGVAATSVLAAATRGTLFHKFIQVGNTAF